MADMGVRWAACLGGGGAYGRVVLVRPFRQEGAAACAGGAAELRRADWRRTRVAVRSELPAQRSGRAAGAAQAACRASGFGRVDRSGVRGGETPDPRRLVRGWVS